EHDGRVQL
ncbi:hypothetical protein EC881467_2429, partial [Escherichia coli 88.1467]